MWKSLTIKCRLPLANNCLVSRIQRPPNLLALPTTHSRDEAVSIAILLGLHSALPDIIADVPSGKECTIRLQCLLKRLEWAPEGFLFSEFPRSDVKGLRWALESFLTANPVMSRLWDTKTEDSEKNEGIGLVNGSTLDQSHTSMETNSGVCLVTERGMLFQGSGFYLPISSDWCNTEIDSWTYDTDKLCSECGYDVYISDID